MSAKRPHPGLAHVTVVPTNLDRDEATATESESDATDGECPACGDPVADH